MAKEVIEIDVNVGEGVKSMKSLKAEFSDIQKELDGLIPGTQKYIDTLQKLGAVKDDVGDLRSEIDAFAGADAKVASFSNVLGGVASGFQAATAAGALFGSESEDLQKSLLKVQSAMALAEGVKGVLAMKDSFKAAANVAKQLAADVLGVANMQKIAEIQTKAIAAATRVWNVVLAANPILLIVAGIGLLVGAFFALDKAFASNKDATEKLIDANNKAIEQSKETVKSIDNEITALGGLTANEEKLIDAKRRRYAETLKQAKLDAQNAALQANKDKELSWLQEMQVATGELIGLENVRAQTEYLNSAESTKLLKEKLDVIKSTKAEQTAFENEQTQKKLDADKEAADKASAAAKIASDKAIAAKQKEADDLKEIQRRLNEAYLNYEKDKNDKLKKEQEDKDKAEDDAIEKAIQADIKKFQDDKEKKKKEVDKYNEEVKASNEAIQEAEGKSIDAMRSLSEGFFAFKSRAAKGNAAEELKIKKQMFAVDKAFNLARAIQDGIRSVQAALTIPPPGGQILAVVNGAIAAGNVAKIAASQFDGGGSGGGVGNVNIPSTGTFTQAPSVSSGQNQTQLNANGTVQQAPIKAYVVESESAAVTKRVNKLENQSKI